MAGAYSVVKRFEIPVDLKRPTAIRDFELVEGDTGNELILTVSDAGTPVDLTNCTVMAVFSHSGGISVLAAEDGTLSVDEDEVTLKLPADAFSAGMVECELQIYSSSEGEAQELTDNDLLVTTARFNFNCRKAILNGETLPAAPHFPLLAETIASIEAAEAAREAAEAARRLAETQRAAAEQLRAQAESLRAQAETGRLLTEGARVQAENARVAAEADRAEAEAERAEAESERVEAESERVEAEADRETAENSRGTAEALRQSAETLRVAAEALRAEAEADRAEAEAERAEAEAERAEAEADREEAEAARELLLAGHIASCGLGVLTSSSAPTNQTEGEAGRLLFDTTANKLYYCSPHGAYYDWTELAPVKNWEKLSEVTLSEDVASIEFGAPGGRLFSCSELRMSFFGVMRSSSAAAVRINGATKAYAFSMLMNSETVNSPDPVCVLVFKAETGEIISVSRYYGGTSLDTVTSKSPLVALCAGTAPFTRVSVTATGTNASFKQGMRIVLEGR